MKQHSPVNTGSNRHIGPGPNEHRDRVVYWATAGYTGLEMHFHTHTERTAGLMCAKASTGTTTTKKKKTELAATSQVNYRCAK